MSPLLSEESRIDRETVLDVTVNAIPMVILLFFVVLFLVINPWGYDPGPLLIEHFLTLFPFLLLGILTYLSARVIARDEAEADEDEDEGFAGSQPPSAAEEEEAVEEGIAEEGVTGEQADDVEADDVEEETV